MSRIETGPIQFGDDWPGLFIRGDNAIGYALQLQLLLDVLATDPAPELVIAVAVLRGLLSDLESCNVRRDPEVTRLKPAEECLHGSR